MTFIISLLIFIVINIGYTSLANEKDVVSQEIKETKEIERTNVIDETKETNIEKTDVDEAVKEKQKEELANTINDIWEIEIPIISLKAPISEGTSQEVMSKFVGHFQDTSIWEGNVGLAAHNRGYPVNYFERLKELKQGDEIIYTTCYGEKIYNVNLITVINDSDWSYLKNSNENIITLITCVENEPKLRRCIQARERKN